MRDHSISAVITCFNYARYLPDAIDSVLNQTLQPIEIIVVDDGSTDRTAHVLKMYEGHPLIRIIRKGNGGQASAKNAGVGAATGEWIAFLDADDVWAPGKLEAQSRLLNRPKTGVVFSRQRFIDENGARLDPQPGRLPVYRGNVLPELMKDNFIPFSSVVVRRACFEEFGPFDESLPMAIDWDLWLRIGTQHEFDYADADLLDYRQGHAGQMSKNMTNRLECCDRIFTRFVENHRRRIPASILSSAVVYSLNNRGFHLRGREPVSSLKFFVRSAIKKPLQLHAWRGIALTPLYFLRYSMRNRQ